MVIIVIVILIAIPVVMIVIMFVAITFGDVKDRFKNVTGAEVGFNRR